MTNSKRKGKTGELEAARALEQYLGCSARRGQQYSGSEDSPDVQIDIPGIHCEVKRTEKLRLWESLEQSTRDAGRKVPVVLHRSNRHEWVVIVHLSDLPALVTALWSWLTSSNSGRVLVTNQLKQDNTRLLQEGKTP